MEVSGDLDEAAGIEQAQRALAHLAARGVTVGRFGLPAERAAADPLRTSMPARHLMSAYAGVLATVRRARLEKWLRSAGDRRSMARLRSSSGPSAGRYLINRPDGEPNCFDDTEWVYALRWRTGLAVSTR